MVIAGLMLTILSPVFAEDLTDVDEIVKRTNHAAYYKGKDGKARVTMTIKDAQDRERKREFVILRKDMGEEDKEQKMYVYFHRPADVREMVFMVHKKIGADDDRWLYLPALDVIKRIAASDERTSFVGSHFFYEDVSGRGIEEDTHEMIETTADYYVLKNTPKKPESVEFDSYTIYVHKATFLPVEITFEKGGTVYRTVKTLGVEEIQGHPTVTKASLRDENIGGETIMEYSSVEYDLDLPDDIFTERYLRRAPREYIK
jgi:outer membrane lipoprotein-sorting protein